MPGRPEAPTAPRHDPAVAHAPIVARHGPRARLRALRRAACVLLGTAFVCALWLLGALVQFWSPQRRHRWRRLLMRLWCRLMCAALGVRLVVDGKLPDRAQFLVCNHLGYLDIAALGSQADAAFVSRADVAHWPGIGWLARQFDTLFLERSRKRDLPMVNAQIQERLQRGEVLVVFPEGTSSAGDSVLPFRSPLLGPAVDGGHLVAAAALRYRTGPGDPAAREAVCWWGDMDFLPHAKALLSVARIEAVLRFAPDARTDTDRKRLAERLQRDVEALFEPSE
jgi:1-acyl-sn-glycerol-3-phosphate acyltransferase